MGHLSKSMLERMHYRIRGSDFGGEFQEARLCSGLIVGSKGNWIDLNQFC